MRLLEAVESCFWWGLYDRMPLASWTKGRLALLGDAAHAMLPHLGQGANQAIEDGVAWQYFSRGGTRPRYRTLCSSTKNYAGFELTSFKPKHGKTDYVMTSKYANLEQRDREIANSGAFRKSLFDYDVEKVAIAHLSKTNVVPIRYWPGAEGHGSVI